MADIDERDAIETSVEQQENDSPPSKDPLRNPWDDYAELKGAVVIGSAEGSIRIDLAGDQSAEQFRIWLRGISDQAGDALTKYKIERGPDEPGPMKFVIPKVERERN